MLDTFFGFGCESGMWSGSEYFVGIEWSVVVIWGGGEVRDCVYIAVFW